MFRYLILLFSFSLIAMQKAPSNELVTRTLELPTGNIEIQCHPDADKTSLQKRYIFDVLTNFAIATPSQGERIVLMADNLKIFDIIRHDGECVTIFFKTNFTKHNLPNFTNEGTDYNYAVSVTKSGIWLNHGGSQTLSNEYPEEIENICNILSFMCLDYI